MKVTDSQDLDKRTMDDSQCSISALNDNGNLIQGQGLKKLKFKTDKREDNSKIYVLSISYGN